MPSISSPKDDLLKTNYLRTNLQRLAAIAWMICISYIPVQLFVASQWSKPFDWYQNYTSNLGNSACEMFQNLYVCSPSHLPMNITFVITGICIIVGGILFARVFTRYKMAMIGFCLIIFSGIGSIIVGLIPENTDFELHSFGALLSFLFGNSGILLIGLSNLIKNHYIRTYTILSGVVGLTAFILFSLEVYPIIGVGGLERLTDYVQIVWFVVFGLYMLRVSSQSK